MGSTTALKSTALQSPVVKSEAERVEDWKLISGAVTAHKSEEKLSCNTDPDSGVKQWGDFINEDVEDVDDDDDYLHRREEHWSQSSSGVADDFTACSAHDCGYCVQGLGLLLPEYQYVALSK
ncbi:uncharacterized protein RAG0_01479 [Rhynchosporium agropyri]|uniref:Uncharacterized protein n=1 Tax=Rhynchosporium agropyri TaxID=914238 RepID=A0A1E1JXJ7_9HELO|nr:uncharacterized protein RAG0_01479 [Rhynchosporium agropyri]